MVGLNIYGFPKLRYLPRHTNGNVAVATRVLNLHLAAAKMKPKPMSKPIHLNPDSLSGIFALFVVFLWVRYSKEPIRTVVT